MSKITLVVSFLFFAVVGLTAQSEITTEPQSNAAEAKGHAMELGLHAGHFFTSGNVDFKPGFGVGLHLRKALDYVFSLRATAMYARANGEDPGNVRSNETTYFSGSLQAVASMNNLKWNTEERRTNFFAFGGFGVNSFEAELTEQEVITTYEADLAAHLEFGAGISFRINDRINVGIEHQIAYILDSQRADWLDGVPTLPSIKDRSSFKDLINYTSVRLNFNLSGKDQKTEPLYWLNPMETIANDLQLLKDTRVVLTDEDGDGVIDALDEEEETAAGAPVNAKGISLDSDSDGVPDFIDLEPFSPPNATVNERGVAEKVEDDLMVKVEQMVEERLKNFQPVTSEKVSETLSLYDWYLPSVYFSTGSSTVEVADYGTLANVALVIKNNQDTKFSVIGFTDSSGSTAANNLLSYQRSKGVLELLVSKFAVPREQLVLQWKGEESSIVEGTNIVNRRVEFHVNNGEAEMDAPDN